MPPAKRIDWEEKTAIDARPAERFASEADTGERALPDLFAEVDDTEEMSGDEVTRVRDVPSEILRAASMPDVHAAPTPADGVRAAVMASGSRPRVVLAPPLAESGTRAIVDFHVVPARPAGSPWMTATIIALVFGLVFAAALVLALVVR